MSQAVLITGASAGIGAALARCYAGPGIFLALCARDRARLEAVAGSCRARGAEVMTRCVDVTDRAAMDAFVRDADARTPLDLVIANAGVSSGMDPDGRQESFEAIDRTFAVNVGGMLNTVVPAVEVMLRRGHGRVVMMGSLGAWRGLPYCPSYSASKAAVETYGEALRSWLRPRKIGVTVVSPGYVRSGMSDRLVGAKPLLMDADDAARLIRQGIERGRSRIAFPFPLTWGTRALSLMPIWLADLVLPFFAFRIRSTPLFPNGNK